MNYFEAAGFVSQILQGMVEKHGQKFCLVNVLRHRVTSAWSQEAQVPNSSQAACRGARLDRHVPQRERRSLVATWHPAPKVSFLQILRQSSGFPARWCTCPALSPGLSM